MALKRNEHSDDLRTLVYHFLNDDSQREIAKKTLLSRETVRPMIKKYKSTKCIGNQFGRGRKRKTAATTDRLIQRKLKFDRRKSTCSIAAELETELGILISQSPVQRRAHEIGLFGRVAHKMIEELTKLLNNCWQKESVPEDWQKGIIIKIPKKGNLNDCNNWRGITLLSVPGKIFCLVLLQRLRDAIEKMLREEQAGFRRGRSCSEQIFTLRNIIEQSTELQQPVFINFIDFKKAFDSVHRDTLWHIVRIYGIPARYINIFKSLYQDSRCCVRTDDGTTDFFNINTGVRQGCVLSPFLFLIAIDFVMRKSMKEVGFGIVWNDQTRLIDLDFADDIALIAETNESLQNMTNKLETEAGKIGLRINAVKTKIMQTGNASTVVHITTGQRPVEQVPHFTYLGSSLSNDGSIHTDVKHRIGKASAIFQRLQSVWTTSKIRTATKLKFYNTIVIPTAIYASETWKFTTKITQKLDAFHQRCLRKILGITYHDRITNDEILHRSGSKRLQDIVTERRMQLAGHILRLPHQRHAYTAIHWTPLGGKRKVGRPQKTWRQTFRNDIRTLDIKYEQIEDEAADRSRWKKLTAQCATMHRRN